MHFPTLASLAGWVSHVWTRHIVELLARLWLHRPRRHFLRLKLKIGREFFACEIETRSSPVTALSVNSRTKPTRRVRTARPDPSPGMASGSQQMRQIQTGIGDFGEVLAPDLHARPSTVTVGGCPVRPAA
jgi:hypothetical protein